MEIYMPENIVQMLVIINVKCSAWVYNFWLLLTDKWERNVHENESLRRKR